MGRKNLNNETVGFADAAADPTLVGELQRNGSDLKHHDGTAARTLATNQDNILWIPADAMDAINGATKGTIKTDFTGILLDAAAEEIRFVFAVPAGFSEWNANCKLQLVYIANANKAGGTDGLDIDCDFAAAGEFCNNHSGTRSGIDTDAVTDGTIYEVDLELADGSAFGMSDLAAGDYVGVKIVIPAFVADSGDRVVIGAKFIWDK